MRKMLGIAISVVLLLSACGGEAGGVRPPSAIVQTQDSASALPGGDSASALPGAQLACAPIATAGTANCSIAINTQIPANADPTTPAAMIPGFHPADLQKAYALPSGNTGETIAIIDAYDDPNAEQDMNVYRTTFGLPLCTSDTGCFIRLNQGGVQSAYPPFNTAWAEETSIDLDMASAVCPHCSILFIEANSASLDDLGAAVDTAVARGAHIVSNSYYSAEWSGERAEDAHYNHRGVVMTVSSGDQAWPSYPAASPYVIAVGGTSLHNGSESPWTYSGHGCSAFEPSLRWQAGLTSCSTRDALDVAAVADPQYGVAMFDSLSGGWLVAGGTSVGAPIIAAAYALADNGAGAPYTYAHASGLHRIGSAPFGTSTGLGSPNALTAF